jgi:hypothetical protein
MANNPANPPQVTHRQDPLNEKYFVPLERVDRISDVVFYAVAILSVTVLFVDSKQYARLNDWLNVGFFTLTVVLFALGVANRLYFAPRAEDARRQEFFATAFGVALTHERTVGYYNNLETEPVRRAAAQTLENAFFSKAIALAMLHRERAIYILYAVIWLIAIANRQTEINIVVTTAQAIFSEQIIARWLRLEWLRARFEDSYEKLYTLFVSGNKKTFQAYALAYVTAYETTKASGGISLASSVFNKLNPSLSVKWDEIKPLVGVM